MIKEDLLKIADIPLYYAQNNNVYELEKE